MVYRGYDSTEKIIVFQLQILSPKRAKLQSRIEVRRRAEPDSAAVPDRCGSRTGSVAQDFVQTSSLALLHDRASRAKLRWELFSIRIA